MTPDEIQQIATAAGRAAKDAYLAIHPEPQVHDLTCPRCGADAGHSCRSRYLDKVLNSHCSRQDRYIRACNRRQYAAIDADDAAYNETYHRLRSQTGEAEAFAQKHAEATS